VAVLIELRLNWNFFVLLRDIKNWLLGVADAIL